MQNDAIKRIELRTDEANQLIQELKGKPPVLLVGSPISEYSPTLLPSGWNFTNALYKCLFNQDVYQRDARYDILLRDLFLSTPFEHLLEICPSEKTIEKFILGLYHVDKSNFLHRVIVNAFVQRKIHSLITTNYDLCLDQELAGYPFDVEIVTSTNEAAAGIQSNLPVYFKIHGSASLDADERPIFNLRGEAHLPEKKRELLEKLIAGRTLILAAYSGLDFDICPAIDRIPNVRLIWNTYDEKLPSVNARNLLRKKDGIQLIGDMKYLFSDWLEVQHIEQEDWSKNEERKKDLLHTFLSAFGSDERKTWLVQVLNSIAAPLPAIRALDDQRIPLLDEKYDVQRARALFHAGKYFDSSRCYCKQFILSLKKKEYKDAGNCLLEIADAQRSAGAIFLPFLFLLCGGLIGAAAMKPRFLLKNALLMTRIWEILMMLNLRPLAALLHRFFPSMLAECARESIESNRWLDYQQVGLIAREAGVPLSVLEVATGYMLPDPKDGYDHLGYYLAEVMVLLDENRQLIGSGFPAGQKDELSARLLQEIDTCNRLGINVLVWKLYAQLKHFIDEREWLDRYQTQYRHALHACQYYPWGEFLQVRRYRMKKI